MLRNLSTGDTYRNLSEAAFHLKVSTKDIRLHLNGVVLKIRGMKIIHIHPKRIRKVFTRPDLRKAVFCLDNEREYISIASAAKRFNLNPDSLSLYLSKGDTRKTIGGMRFRFAENEAMTKAVRIVETGEVFRSAADAAATLGVTVGAVTHCLKGRRKSVAGCTVEYDTSTAFAPRTVTRRCIMDSAGRWYGSYAHVGRSFGVSPAQARTLTLKNGGVFPVPVTYSNDLFAV